MEKTNGEAGSMLALTGTIAVSKKNAGEVATEMRARVADGRIDLLHLYERLQFMVEVADQFADDATRAQVRKLIEERGAGTGKVMAEGGVFAVRATATKYDYTGDRPWQDLNAMVQDLNGQKKKREEFLKTLPHTITESYTPPAPIGSLDPHAEGAVMAVQITTRPPNVSSVEGFAYTMNKGE